jgi:hypothetical protein
VLVHNHYFIWLTFSLMAVNTDASGTPVSCAKCLDDLQGLSSDRGLLLFDSLC